MSKRRKLQRSEVTELGLSASASNDSETSANFFQAPEENNGAGIKSWLAFLKEPSNWWLIALVLFLTLGTLGAGLKYLEDSARKQSAGGKTNNYQNQGFFSRLNPLPPILLRRRLRNYLRNISTREAQTNCLPSKTLTLMPRRLLI